MHHPDQSTKHPASKAPTSQPVNQSPGAGGAAFHHSDLPASLRPLLWPYAHDAALPAALVAATVMERGDLEAMRWLLRSFGQERLRSLLPGLTRRLSPRSLALWSHVLDITLPPPSRIPWIADTA